MMLYRTINCLFFIVLSLASFGQSTISFTFDDGNLYPQADHTLEEWNNMILNSLDSAEVKAVFFVKTEGKANEKGKYLLDSWNSRGHLIANHTYSHPYFNSEKVSAADFQSELLKADSLISSYSQYTKLFRFPYLKEGNTTSKVDSIRQFLKTYGYQNGYVTIDASDWYIDSRLTRRLRREPNADLQAYKNFYLEHLFDRATYYDELAFQLTGRRIKHTLLLHHNLAAAFFLDDLIKMFKQKGWHVISADEAYKDPIYDLVPEHAGESLIWALAKDSGLFEQLLRYPAEDSRYEKDRMDALGL